jgi:DNA modification methylase
MILKTVQRTAQGSYVRGDCVEFLRSRLGKKLKGRVQLILTSPPFPLNNKKSYGNLQGEEYLDWFKQLAPPLAHLLTPTGSIVLEIGNAWLPGRPVQSLLHLESLVGFVKNPQASLRLCQQFIAYNPSRLPSPAEWVTIRRIRLTDSYTHLWWMSKTDFPYADNRQILRPYSSSMKSLFKRNSYNSGKRPSEHSISKNGFLKRHRGSIPHNLFELEAIDPGGDVRLPNAFRFSNTASNDFFFRACREHGLIPHPARMPVGLASFFVQFLTKPGDLVFDPFAGSNTTGFAAEALGRRWLAVDVHKRYFRQSLIRFRDPRLKHANGARRSRE